MNNKTIAICGVLGAFALVGVWASYERPAPSCEEHGFSQMIHNNQFSSADNTYTLRESLLDGPVNAFGMAEYPTLPRKARVCTTTVTLKSGKHVDFIYGMFREGNAVYTKVVKEGELY